MSGLTAEEFRRDVSKHVMHVMHNDGLYRHLMLSDGTFNLKFHVVTFPGTLVFTGDAGCYVFERIVDMFDYFRTYDPGDSSRVDAIAPETWAGKCVAGDKHNGIREFDVEAFKARTKEDVDAFVQANGLNPEDADMLWDEVQSALDGASDNTWGAFVTALDVYRWNEFTDGSSKGDRVFSEDIWHTMPDCQAYTRGFLWACRAIRWAIATFDAGHKPGTGGVAERLRKL